MKFLKGAGLTFTLFLISALVFWALGGSFGLAPILAMGTIAILGAVAIGHRPAGKKRGNRPVRR